MPDPNTPNLHESAMNTDKTRPIVLILGPTAGGKTTLSIDLANQLPGGGEIIGADSMQVYKQMDIGTAKPTMEERSQAVHHVIDIVEPSQPFTVDDWLTLTEHHTKDIRERGKWPIVVGGTNLYVRVLLEGMFKGPAADPVLRAKFEKVDLPELWNRLKTVDPEAAERIHINDRKRITRALEVFESTGKPITEHQRQWSATGSPGLAAREDSIIIGLDWAPEEINPRINQRVKQMMEEGFLAEVQRLQDHDQLGAQAKEALGYKQLLKHIDGSDSLSEAVERVKIETRRFARKQRTWLRRFRAHPRSLWLPGSLNDAQTLSEQAVRFCLGHANMGDCSPQVDRGDSP